MKAVRFALVAGVLLVGVSAKAQMFFNGNFETGNMSGWTVGPTANGMTATQTVLPFDIDGPGTRPTNFAARFEVGQVTFNSGVPAGMELTQSLNLTAGWQYYFDFDWATQQTNPASNAEGGIYSLIVNGSAISTQATGGITTGTTVYGHVTGIFTPTTSGFYTIGARITRPFITPGGLFQHVDNFAVTAVPEPATMAVLAIGGAFLARRRRK